LLIFLVTLTAFLGFAQELGLRTATAGYDNGKLIDDGIFLNSSTMSKEAIQSFLVSKNSGLASQSFTFNCNPNINGLGPAGAQAYTNAGAPCGQSALASTFIYYASQIYGINPQVILATIQKEQSAITSQTLTSWQINQAMGYGCPDLGGCGASNFPYQVDWGTYTLRLHRERANGNMTWWQQGIAFTCGISTRYYKPSLYPGQNVSFYDDSGVMYTTAWIANAATSSLYCYTPHAYNNPPTFGTVGQYYSGSYNFVLFFERWFGSTQGSFLVKSPSSPTYYLLTNGQRYAIPNGDILYAYGLESIPLTGVSDAYLSSIPDGGMLGTLFTVPGDPTVYLADGGSKIGIASGAACSAWGLVCGSNITQKEVGQEIANRMQTRPPLQPIMKFQNTYYLMQGGQKLPFLTEKTVAERGYNTTQSTPIINWTNAIRPIGNLLPEDRSFVKFEKLGAIYYYASGGFYSIADFDTFLAWIGNSNCYLDDKSGYNNTPPNTVGTLRQIIQDANLNYYLITRQQKVALNGASPAAGTYMLYSNALPLDALASKQAVALDGSKAVSVPGGTIFSVRDNMLKPIPTMTDLWQQYDAPNIISLPSKVLSAYPLGRLSVAPGRVIKPTGSGAMYVLGSDHNLWALGSLSELFAINTWSPGALEVDMNAIDFTNIHVYTRLISLNGFPYIVKSNGQAAKLPSGILAPGADLLPMDGLVAGKIPYASEAVRFLRFDNGTIFYVGDTSLQPIASLSKYLSLGGNDTNTLGLPIKSLGNFVTGTVLY
jgi:hypothetical protein